MKRNLVGFAGNLVFALGSFIFFLLIFESKLTVPTWLQPVGRMHPLLLHFPIVLLLLAMLMEFFRSTESESEKDSYGKFSTYLLLAGLITSGLTVIMGMFLSREEGYNPVTLSWHKWSGVALFYFACLVYVARNASWYGASVPKVMAVVTTGLLISAGHFGATLTHGDNFIWQPVLVSQTLTVSPEEAIVFDHVIKPILDKKCVSCHNADKLKGKLKLSDSISLLKGGKSGELFVSGKPDESRLIERIELPLEEKKHMPPSGKPQLTREEQSLLYAWIRSGAAFNKKLMSLPESDTFRLAAVEYLEKDVQEEVYDFPSVAHHTVDRLNSDYRVVRPVAVNSPALSVNIYNKSIYTPRTLDELKDVRQQVVSLQLSKMPVTDEDLKYIVRLDNLQTLNLNFTSITGEGLATLSQLGNLESLSLAGTGVTYPYLQRYLPLFERLETITLWDTNLKQVEIEKLQSEFKHLRVEGGVGEDGSSLIKLNAPRLRNRTVVFDDTLSVELFHPVRGVDIRYSTDGTPPDSVASPAVEGHVTLEETTAIRARAFKAGWLSSDVATLNVYRRRHTPDTVVLQSRLNRVHTGKGAKTFFDYELGTFNANSPAWANNWGGVINNDLVLLLKYDSPRVVSSVSLNTLIETETYIFPPVSIEVWGGASEDQLRLIGRLNPEMPKDFSKPYIRLENCNFKPASVSFLKIVAKPVMKLPEWHKRKDKPALLLVDEILVN